MLAVVNGATAKAILAVWSAASRAKNRRGQAVAVFRHSCKFPTEEICMVLTISV